MISVYTGTLEGDLEGCEQAKLGVQIIEGKSVATSLLDVWLPTNDGLMHMHPGDVMPIQCTSQINTV